MLREPTNRPVFLEAVPYGQLFISFMQNSPAQWWMKDAHGRYFFVNKTYAEFFQLAPESIVGRTDFDFMPSYIAEQLRANDRVVLETQKAIQIHETIEPPDGTRILLSSKFPFTENGRKFVGGIGLDVTQSRRTAVELEAARDRALESEALKSAFISSIQHELRTPLAGIIGMNELLLMSKLDPEQTETARLVQGSGQALLTVINDILDLSKFESGRLKLSKQPVNIKSLVEESMRLMAAAARHKGLKLSLEMDDRLPDRLQGDAERLRQVLLNLLSNAVKFTPQGRVEVKVSLIEQSNETVFLRFLVKDTGIGIEPQKQPYLFMPFWQADMSNTRIYGGPGLGLPVSKHIVEKMGSKGIQVESVPGQGSSFWFDAPFSTQINAADNRVAAPDIVIVEDNAMLQASIAKQFENLGIAVEAVTNGSDAEKITASKPCRLMLCEQVLQDGDALDLVQRIRTREAQTGGARTTIVVMAADPQPEDRTFYIAHGADDYVAKPLSVEQVWRIVSYWGMI
jgi:two-component system, sensor histidine kinase and response regulator